VLVDAVRAGQDPGNSESLLRYERWRQAVVGLVVTLTDGQYRLFSNDLAPAKLVRSLGLAGGDRLPPLKHLALRRGMGLLGELPRLARGEALGARGPIAGRRRPPRPADEILWRSRFRVMLRGLDLLAAGARRAREEDGPC
jgi:hypothetical protein